MLTILTIGFASFPEILFLGDPALIVFSFVKIVSHIAKADFRLAV